MIHFIRGSPKNDNEELKDHLVHVADSHRGKVNLIERPRGVVNGDYRLLLRKCVVQLNFSFEYL